ncbi:sortase [Ellagibacter isourolithinifaciens]|uniref:Sortase n=1 Tax=Ellagibacter isourolithinifaciens TaxID=2137581 RepID=A0A6N6NRA5_9ACTN|nr:class B sortase [Ellagibacter isourolithinifaciens]KAB1640508.1 sortase [Ellagibacter isourolithinifaciens]
MKRIRKAAKATSVIIIAILTALTLTILCASEEERIEIAETVDNLSDQEEPERQIDWDSLPAEVVAWVEVPGTSIDEPIAQAMPDVPNAYLYRDVFGQGAYGTPYIDCECTIDSRFVMVYGHHMSDGTAFAEFADFIDEGFAREHSRIIVYKRSGDTLELMVCAVDIVNASRERLVIDQEEGLEEIIGTPDLQLADTSDASQLFAFTTCSYQTRNSRTVVYATI